MSGHSKWATIKRQKAINDGKKGAAFTKLSKAITIAVQQGGGIGDPSQNFRLRLAIDAARGANMPKDNIDRAIQKAVGKQGQALEEVMYEGFAPGGVAVIVEAATDNRNRTTGEVQNVFNKNGGNMGQPGSVLYQFKQVGQIIIKKTKSIDELFLEAADAGAEDLEEVGTELFVYTQPADLARVRDALSQKGIEMVETSLVFKATIPSQVDEQTAQRVFDFVSKLEDIDDVQKVYSNLE